MRFTPGPWQVGLNGDVYSPEQQLRFLARDVLPLLEAVHAGTPTTQQPAPTWTTNSAGSMCEALTLGEYARASRLLPDSGEADYEAEWDGDHFLCLCPHGHHSPKQKEAIMSNFMNKTHYPLTLR